MATQIQTIIFPKDKWSESEVKEWLREHDFATELDETEESYRARQKEPSEFQEDSFRTICLTPEDADPGSEKCRIKAVIGRPKALAAKFFTSRVNFQELGYQKVEGVLILKTGKVSSNLELTQESLREIVRNFELRRSQGNYPVVFIGHHKNQENPIYGFIDNLRIDGENLVGDFYLDRKHLDVLRYYPRRSAELWLENGELFLDGVALLGSSAPKFDLGLLLAASKNSNCGCSRSFKVMLADDSTAITEEIGKLWIKIEAIEKRLLEIAERLNVTEGPPASSEPDASLSCEEEEVKMSQDLAALIEAQKKEIDELRAQLQEERARRIRIERENVLRELSNTYEFSVEKELVRCEKMSEEQFAEHVQLIRENYKVKQNRGSAPYPNFAALSRDSTDIEEKIHEEAMRLAMEATLKNRYVPYSECYEQAKAKFLGQKVLQ